MILYKRSKFLIEISLSYLQTTQYYSLQSPLLKLMPCLYQLASKLPYIRINSHSLYTNMYGIEPLLTWINPFLLYTKMYGIEPCHILPILLCINCLLYVDVWAMFDKHILRVIIFVVPDIVWDIPLPCTWYQPYFTCLVVVSCCSSTVHPTTDGVYNSLKVTNI